jgi:hypothetical protein
MKIKHDVVLPLLFSLRGVRTFLKKGSDTSKNFENFYGWIFNVSVLSVLVGASLWGPCPKRLSKKKNLYDNHVGQGPHMGSRSAGAEQNRNKPCQYPL